MGVERQKYEAAEKELEVQVSEAIEQLGIEHPTQVECLRADLRLQLLYPGKWIVFFDLWTAGKLMRAVVAVADTRDQCEIKVAKPDFIPPSNAKIQLSHVHDPSGPLYVTTPIESE